MKKTFILATCIFFGFNSLIAQSNSEDVDIVQAAWGKEKKQLVSEYMQVPAKDSVAFWKLYDEYESKRKAIGKERIDLLGQYADNYDNLTDAKASELGTKTLANDAKYTALYQDYLKKFSAVSGGKNAAKLIQLELYLQTLMKAKVQTEIPFIDELDKSKVQAPQQ
jgi:hypothetical protein